MVNLDVSAATEYVATSLAARADPEKALRMQAYMKTDMPFYGVQKGGRTPILRHAIKEFVPASADEYEGLVRALWALPHREEKYIALGVTRHHQKFIVPDQISLYRDLIVEGAWWDFVDEVATQLIRTLVISHPDNTWSAVDNWIDDEDMWLRRTAIICQVGAKEHTDSERLFDFCARRMHEKEFFIRKAIGWLLREYAKTDPEAVAGFINQYADSMSGLSYREASKHIRDVVKPR